MPNIYTDLLDIVNQVGSARPLPVVQKLIIPKIAYRDSNKYAKFGLLVLEDSSSGFFYFLADPTVDSPDTVNAGSIRHLTKLTRQIEGQNVAVTSELLLAKDNLSRGIGMAAVNALSMHVFRTAGYVLPQPGSASASSYKPMESIGMIGYFAPVVAQLKASSIPTTVLELDESLYEERENFIVTGDVARLEKCELILCTASTLINQTLEPLLDALCNPKQRVAGSRRFELIGPSCACFADPLFNRGVNSIGGSRVVSTRLAIDRIQNTQPWGEAVAKFQITPDNYPGFDSLFDAFRSASESNQTD